jgi:uncharacterized protein (DUF1778 family)
MSTSGPPVSVRLSPVERSLLESAATHANTNLSDFVRRKALEAAELELFDRRIVTIPVSAWETFESWAQSPAKTVPALRELAAAPPLWQD